MFTLGSSSVFCVWAIFFFLILAGDVDQSGLTRFHHKYPFFAPLGLFFSFLTLCPTMLSLANPLTHFPLVLFFWFFLPVQLGSSLY